MKALLGYLVATSLAATSMCDAGTYTCDGDDSSYGVEYNNNYLRDQFDQLGLEYTKSATFWIQNGNDPTIIWGQKIKDVQLLQFCEDSDGKDYVIRQVLTEDIHYYNATRNRLRWNDTCRLQVEVRWSSHGDYHRVHDAYDGKKAGISVWVGTTGKFGYDDLSGCR
ncbi:hypothetical protein [Pseudoruegeria sp. HB172150]|uniref:hypothetical protein n=1 Tax=Pseudoruegeria sp. HB172150 TaxID=2721164 RepID=UPI001555BB93|nr:hypothetical protein [Pseudoruegeria sp. HB172150]